jgi:TonB family protein
MTGHGRWVVAALLTLAVMGGTASVGAQEAAVPAARPPPPRPLHWTARPAADDVQAAYPPAALSGKINGSVTLRCQITPKGKLAGCQAVNEDPAGYGFGEAALKLAPLYAVSPNDLKDVDLTTTRINVPIQFGAFFTPQPPPPPPSPEVLARLRAATDALITSSGAPGLFTDATENTLTAVRHTPSGFYCVFPPRPATISVAGQGPNAEVTCSSATFHVGNTGIEVSIVLSHTPGVTDPQAALDRQGRALLTREPDLTASPFLGKVDTAITSHEPDARYPEAWYRREGGGKVTFIAVAISGDWTATVRVTGDDGVSVLGGALGRITLQRAVSGPQIWL